jgi:hypothetical protein
MASTAHIADSTAAFSPGERVGSGLPSRHADGTALRQRGWGGRLQRVDGTRRARHARSRRAGGGTQSGRWARPFASAAGEGDCRARTAAACTSRAIATRRRRHTVRPLGAAGLLTPQDPTGPPREKDSWPPLGEQVPYQTGEHSSSLDWLLYMQAFPGPARGALRESTLSTLSFRAPQKWPGGRACSQP